MKVTMRLILMRLMVMEMEMVDDGGRERGENFVEPF